MIHGRCQRKESSVPNCVAYLEDADASQKRKSASLDLLLESAPVPSTNKEARRKQLMMSFDSFPSERAVLVDILCTRSEIRHSNKFVTAKDPLVVFFL